MDFWESFYVVATVVSAVSTSTFFAWFFYDVFWRDSTPRTGGRYEPDRERLARLQAKRRQALRQLGDKWVLDPKQPPVKWGYRHD
jgi:hypothetical protein